MAEYIEREALMRRIKEIHCAECDSYHGVRCRACWVDDTLDYIDSEPAADVAPIRHGRWHKLAETKLTKTVECTHCHYTVRYNKANGVPFDKAPFCLSCGAKMDGGVDGG